MNRRDLDERVTISVEDAGRVLGLGRAAAYRAAQRGDIPTIRIGSRLIVSTAALLARLDAGSAPIEH